MSSFGYGWRTQMRASLFSKRRECAVGESFCNKTISNCNDQPTCSQLNSVEEPPRTFIQQDMWPSRSSQWIIFGVTM